MLTFATKKLSTGAQWTKGGNEIPFCPRSFDRAVMVAQWYGLRLVPRETRVRTLPWASSGHVTTRTRSPLRRRSPMLTFAIKKLSTGAQWTKGGNEIPFFCPRGFDRAVMVVKWYCLPLVPKEHQQVAHCVWEVNFCVAAPDTRLRIDAY